jgi:signal transduction histidine kinase
LWRYLARQQEGVLQQAYELGRAAIAKGLGVLDMARIHQRAMECYLLPTPPIEVKAGLLRAAETFFMETLAPFEAAHRGFRKANLELYEANQALEAGNQELARANHDLEAEVAARRRTEKALRESEELYRLLFHQARLMQENLRHLSIQILHVQEEERKRVSRELHDEVGQALTAVSTNLEMLQRNGAEEAHRKIADAQSLLAQTMDAVHQFARELRPPMLDELGLLPALRSYLRGFAERTGVRVRFSSIVEAELLSAEQKTVVFRVAQESLNNVVKHAQASQVSVTFRKVKGGVQIRIHDNGKGFKVDRLPSGNGKKRLGLLGMQERARLINSRFEIRSAPGKGTTVSVEISFKAASSLTSCKAISSSRNQPKGSLGQKNDTRSLNLPVRRLCKR